MVQSMQDDIGAPHQHAEEFGGNTRPPAAPYQSIWQHGMASADEDISMAPEPDAFIAIGKMVKGAARTLWKRVSHSSLRDKRRAHERMGDKSDDKEDGEDDGSDTEVETIQVPPAKRRPSIRRSVSAPVPRPSSMVSDESVMVRVLVKDSGHLSKTTEEDQTS